MTKIFIHDEFKPETIAMIQALYSRSSDSVENHVKQVSETGSDKFLSSYYVGYGHASIGDCGTTTLFFEGLSILATKALQDNFLYSGTECSTRYIDYSTQAIFDPIKNEKSKEIFDAWIKFYTDSMPIVIEYLKEQFPFEQDTMIFNHWEKTIKARAFDILRGYLPAGVTTQMSWTTNLRQAHEKLYQLQFHPLKEVSDLAEKALDKLKEKYPASFSHKVRPEIDAYNKSIAIDNNYALSFDNMREDEFEWSSTVITPEKYLSFEESLYTRPKGAALPKHLKKYGTYTCKFLLDYGSFRDIQRHRNGLCQIPLLDTDFGFNSWYLEQLPKELQVVARDLYKQQYKRIEELSIGCKMTEFDVQYFLPLGQNVLVELVYDLPQMVYVTELRSSAMVHPTLRRIAHKMHHVLKEKHPDMNLYTDLSEDSFDIKRGTQDIIKK